MRQTLIDGARQILAERGHEQFSLNEVARRAGVSTAAPYRHFSGRDELLAGSPAPHRSATTPSTYSSRPSPTPRRPPSFGL
ncbi:helix-turn-helix domain-containing protein [Streptomyces sp. NPDC090022]|uniref:helix-turn-helix domain-containing protein n=1 Tax=Streptomyces sp. NPDC090022 TaxID=3365920 RepID=UPI00381469AB